MIPSVAINATWLPCCLTLRFCVTRRIYLFISLSSISNWDACRCAKETVGNTSGREGRRERGREAGRQGAQKIGKERFGLQGDDSRVLGEVDGMTAGQCEQVVDRAVVRALLVDVRVMQHGTCIKQRSEQNHQNHSVLHQSTKDQNKSKFGANSPIHLLPVLSSWQHIFQAPAKTDHTLAWCSCIKLSVELSGSPRCSFCIVRG